MARKSTASVIWHAGSCPVVEGVCGAERIPWNQHPAAPGRTLEGTWRPSKRQRVGALPFWRYRLPPDGARPIGPATFYPAQRY
jgi:hypothetical protein